jgi:predicted amidohydrolase YtcJ
MRKNAFIFFTAIVLLSCKHKKNADLIIYNAKIYTVDSVFSVCEAMAIVNGSVDATGTTKKILADYDSKLETDAAGNCIYPGFIDSHCHFLGYGLGLGRINLVGTRSFAEVMDRVRVTAQKNAEKPGSSDLDPLQTNWILGRGWDQNDWDNKEMPNNHHLDSLFPDRPVMLTRIDGHAVLVNSAALRAAGITAQTTVDGGELILKDGKLTGVLVDNAIDLIKNKIPETSIEEKTEALLNAQSDCIALGLTTVDDAGLMKEDVDLINDLQTTQKLKIRMYVMLSDSTPNYEYYLERGPFKTDRLNVCSFKFYADGALGSRGACLHEAYNDKPDWKGFLLSQPAHFEKKAELLAKKGFQMNTHCIGDSAGSVLLGIYKRHCDPNKSDRRWRIEHAQVIHPDYFGAFNKNVLPSVQPTHATSDMYWLAERLGESRSKNAYANKRLCQASGLIALGTDFPVEDISPFETFFAAVARQDSYGFPEGGFQTENALTREEALRGMTIWGAYANFEEKEKGSLEKGKLADFIMLDRDIMTCHIKEALETKVIFTYIHGERVYSGIEDKP